MQDRDLCSVVCYQSLLTGNVQGRKPCKPMELIKSYYDSISDNTQIMQSVSGTASYAKKKYYLFVAVGTVTEAAYS